MANADLEQLVRFNLTDLGNARRFSYLYGNDIRYVHGWDRWLVWNGRFWEEDSVGEINRRVRQTLDRFYFIARELDDPDARHRMLRWRLISENINRLRAMTDLAKDEKPIWSDHRKFDQNPWLLNVQNGTLDLLRGTIREFDKSDYLTKGLDVFLDPKAASPNWNRFIERVLPSADVRRFVQKAVGYTLTGSVREQCLFFLEGIGRNGKSTFVETLKLLMGPYSFKAPSSLIMSESSSGIPNDVAKLPGRRLVITPEVEEGVRIAESRLKDLSGGDTLSARFMRAEWFEFSPTHKLWVYGNYRPEIRGTDEGIWRRIRLIKFPTFITDDEVDLDLPIKLSNELSGILNWALEGTRLWLEEGLGVPAEVQANTRDYRQSMDELGEFVDGCIVVDVGGSCPKNSLYKLYKDQGGRMSKRQLTNAMRRRGFEDGHGNGNVPIWLDIKIKTVSTSPQITIKQATPEVFSEVAKAA